MGGLVIDELAADRPSCREHQVRQLHRGRRLGGCVTRRRSELERSHGTVGGIGQAVERRDALGRHSLLGHPGVDERVAEAVR